MRILLRAVFVIGCGAFLAACGGGNSSSTAASTSPTSLAAGSTTTMAANSSVNVPSGTTVTAPNGTVVTVNGSSDTIVTQAGAIVTVPASATGPANDVVTTEASGSGLATSTLSATSLAGSATTNVNPVDGTGAAAILWGGGHLTLDASDNIFLSDRASLRMVTQAGVVTTLTTQGNWDGVAADSSGKIYGSGYFQALATSPVTYGASLQELSNSAGYQQLFANWESSSTPEIGIGGLVMDSHGDLFQADTLNNRIVKFDIAANTWAVFAGSGTAGNQDGAGTAATFTLYGQPDIAVDGNDNLYVRSLDTIREITPDGTVTTIASQLPVTGTIAADKSGNVYTTGPLAIYRLDSGGSLVSYQIPHIPGAILSIVADSSGNLYAGTRGIGAQIFKITFPSQ